jgi:hypothetical protein
MAQQSLLGCTGKRFLHCAKALQYQVCPKALPMQLSSPMSLASSTYGSMLFA